MTPLDLESARIPVGSVWRHYKGDLYTVLGHALREHDRVVLVIYKRSSGRGCERYGAPTWARPAREWEQAVKSGAPRFEREQ